MSMPYTPFSYPMGVNPMMGRSFPTNPPATLYIGNLDEAVHEEQLYAHFSKYGQIHSVKIVRDRALNKSRGFGYVNFFNIKEAENARLLSQYEKIGRKAIRILHKGDPKRPEANLFVKNVDPSVTEKDLHNHFSKSGPVVSVKIVADKGGKSLGYGYVQFEKPEDADKAVEELQGSKLKEQEIGIEKFKPRGAREVTTNNNLYVRHLPEGNKEEIEKILHETFEKFGKVLSLLPIPKDGKWSAFICYEKEEDAQSALDELNGKVTLNGADQPLYVNLHATRDNRAQNQGTSTSQNETNLFIKNLKPEVTEEQLVNVLKDFGEIVSATVKEKEHDGKKFGQAFINFKYAQDASTVQINAKDKDEVKALFYNDQPYIGFLLNKEQRSQFKQMQANRKYQQQANPYGYQKDMLQMQMQMYPQYPPNYYPPNYGMMQQRFPPQNPMQQPQMQQRGPWMGGSNFQPQQQPMQQSQQQQFGQQQQQYGGQNFPRQQQGQQMNRSRQGPFGNQMGGQRPQNRPYQQGGQQQRQGGDYRGDRQGGDYRGDRQGGDYRGERQGGDYRGGYQRRGGQYQNQNQRPQNETDPNSVQGTEKAQTTKQGEGAQLTVQNLKDKLEEFLKLDQDRQRSILGEMLFPKVLGLSGPVNAPKITGMLVDFEVLSVQEILELLEDNDVLKERVGEASELIEQENN